MPARALAQILRERLTEVGPKAAAEACAMIEQLHGRRKLDQVLLELELLFEAEREAYEARKIMLH